MLRLTPIVLVSACRFGFDPLPPDEGTPSDAVDDAVGDAVDDANGSTSEDGASPRCPSGRGPAMTEVPAGYCIDNTEVTKAQYQVFLDANQALRTDGRCSFNTTYQAVAYVWNATTNPEQAVAGIDWCDARDFCAWAGKRLCGRISGGGLGYANHASSESQWYIACSQGGTRSHPYGTASNDDPQPGFCYLDGTETTTGLQAVVGTYPQCKLVGTQVVDLLGNLQEWVDACDANGATPGEDNCRAVGGVWYFGSSYSNCGFADPSTSSGGLRRGMTEKHIGFRCCAD